jgi:hypothetical protein
MENLDLKCAEVGKAIAGSSAADVGLLKKALGVLEEQGVYALFLFLKIQRKKNSEEIPSSCEDFLRQTPKDKPLLGAGDLWDGLKKLSENLDDLLFARDLLRQVFIYALYHQQAKSGE